MAKLRRKVIRDMYSKDLTVDVSTYVKMMTEFFYLLCREIIVEKYLWYVPYSKGKIRIKKLRRNIMPPNWIETKKRGKLVRHKNFHSDGFVFRYKWYKPSITNWIHKSLFKLKPVSGWDGRSKKDYGKVGLSEHIRECRSSKIKKDYDAEL